MKFWKKYLDLELKFNFFLFEWKYSNKVEGIFYVNTQLKDLMFEELRNSFTTGGLGGFLPGMKQIANVAALPGIVGVSTFFPFISFFFIKY